MATNKFLEEMSPAQIDLSSRVFDLALSRVLRGVYINLGEEDRKNMETTFLSDDDNIKEKFIKKYIPNFKKLFKEEMKKIEIKIKAEIEQKA